MKLCCATRSVSVLLTAAFRVRNSKPHSPRRPPFVPFGGKSCRKAEFLEKRACKSEKCFAKKQGFQRCGRFAQSIVFPAEPLDGKQSDFLEKGRNSIILLPYPRLTRAHTVPAVCSEGVPCAPKGCCVLRRSAVCSAVCPVGVKGCCVLRRVPQRGEGVKRPWRAVCPAVCPGGIEG